MKDQVSFTGILYRITGSIASNLYAIPRMTRDIDIVIQIKKEDSAKPIEIFRDDFYIKLDSMTEAVEKCGLFHIIHSRLGPRPWPGDRSRSTRPGFQAPGEWRRNEVEPSLDNESVFKVDLIVRKNSAYRELEFQRRRPMQMEGTPLWVVTPEDLILSKLFWARDSLSELQLGDVRNLLRTLKDLDKDYLEKWVRSLGLEKIYAQVKGPRFASGSGGCQKPAASDTPGNPLPNVSFQGSPAPEKGLIMIEK